MQRIAGTVAIMLYEMKIWPDGTLECLTFVGLEALIGPVPEGMTPDEAYDAAVHPDDREAYDATGEALARGESVEIEYRLLGRDGQTRWVLDRMRPEGTARRTVVSWSTAWSQTSQPANASRRRRSRSSPMLRSATR